ncbi:MAG: LPXTG cell wall anchor domain-containing protein [Oscillospiraceae bacterium]|jgi:LPXTG-motif cell wall-anchored protein|nr:LPXTG cell wall anchor domain-containing protein [Oscillospiraceae bacterium]
MKKALTLILTLSMLLTFGMFAFAEELDDGWDADLEQILGQSVTTTAPEKGLNSDVSAVLGDSIGGDLLSTVTDLFSGFDLSMFTNVLGDSASSMGLDLSTIFDLGNLGDMDIIATFADTIGGLLAPMGIDVQSFMGDSALFGFFSKLYTGIYTGGGGGSTVPTNAAPPPTDDGNNNDNPTIPNTGVEMNVALVAMGVLVVAVGAAFALRKKKVAV